ncbi:hypothetical protein [Streptomyces sp. NRRL B-24484]|uniref:hypothetical protein n=1 Tax=Streptomyces sp. NRRL B-24484 TaxID=1463833 RepID=UPI0004C00092|nr:hypothetical protein [Streptomyces sp. NRRL B-24484]
MKLRGAVCLLVVVVLVLAGLWLRGGAAAGSLPEASWGAWRTVDVEHWSVHVRVNAWAHAAEADLHFGKAEDLELRAYGANDARTAVSESVRFTLHPDGTLTTAPLTSTGDATGR